MINQNSIPFDMHSKRWNFKNEESLFPLANKIYEIQKYNKSIEIQSTPQILSNGKELCVLQEIFQC